MPASGQQHLSIRFSFAEPGLWLFFIKHEEFGRIPQEINGQHLHGNNLQAGTRLQVCNQLLSFFRDNQLNFFISDFLAGLEKFQPVPFHDIAYEQNGKISKKDFRVTEAARYCGVYGGYYNGSKQEGHLLDGNLACPVADNGKKGKQSEGETGFQFHITKQTSQKKNENVEYVKDKQIIAVFINPQIDFLDKKNDKNEVYAETHQEDKQIIRIKQSLIQKLDFIHNCL